MSPSLILRLHRNPLLSSSSSLPTIHLTLHIWSELDVLMEVAYVAADIVVRLQAERYQGDEAELESCLRT